MPNENMPHAPISRRRFLKNSAAAGSAIALLPGQPIAAAPANKQPNSPSAILQNQVVDGRLDLSPAKWIWYPSERCLQNTFVLFRREFELKFAPRIALGWVLADSRYELLVNGERINWGPTPCDPRWLEADPVDITSALRPGKNVIAAKVLFYGQGDGTSPLGKPGFIFNLTMNTEEEGNYELISDSSWKAHLARSWKPGQYKRWYLRSLQEEFDARLYPYGWEKPEFEINDDWLPAMEIENAADDSSICSNYSEYMLEIRGNKEECYLSPRSVPLMKEYEVPVALLRESYLIDWKRPPQEYFECMPPDSFKAVKHTSVIEKSAGEWGVEIDGESGAALTFEFKDQVVGWPYFTIDAPEGTVIEMMVHEAHQPGGPPLLNSHYNSWTRFICKQGVNKFHTFDFESCRWIQLHIHGTKGEVTIRNIGVLRRIYNWPNQPQVRSSEPALQRLFDATINTLHNCAQETIVDGMARERQQYSGDVGHTLHSIYYTFGETRQPARYLKTFSQGMTKDGYFLDCWPAYDRMARLMERQLNLTKWGPLLDHGIGLNFDCYHHYLYTGDLKALEEPYPRLLRFAEFLKTIIRDDGLLAVEDIGIPAVWLDHNAFEQQRHKQCAFNLYASAMFKHALAPICRAFGDDDAAARFIRLSESLQAAAVKKYWSKKHGMFVNNLPWVDQEGGIRMCDRSLATSVLFDQNPKGNITNTIKTLVECPGTMGLSYPANAGWRLWALSKAGRNDVLVDDLRKRWATMDSVVLNNTLQEDWTAKKDGGSQWSHCPVAPLYLLFMNLIGIQPLENGFTRCQIRPQLADLGDISATAYTVRGPIQFSSKGKPGARKITLDIPDGMNCELVVPKTEKINLAKAKGSSPDGCARYQLKNGGNEFSLVSV